MHKYNHHNDQHKQHINHYTIFSRDQDIQSIPVEDTKIRTVLAGVVGPWDAFASVSLRDRDDDQVASSGFCIHWGQLNGEVCPCGQIMGIHIDDIYHNSDQLRNVYQISWHESMCLMRSRVILHKTLQDHGLVEQFIRNEHRYAYNVGVLYIYILLIQFIVTISDRPRS